MSYDGIAETELAVRLRELADRVTDLKPADLDRMARVATRAPALGGAPTSARRRPRSRTMRLWPRLALAMGSAVAVVAICLAVAGLLRQPTAAAAGVRFSRIHGFIVARITDPAASAASLRQAFAEHDLNIHLSLVPVSPSLVGTVIYIGEDGGGIEAIQGGGCVTGGGGCPIGLRIPRDYDGEAYISLGRAAQAGESYASTASVFGPGEPLHCSGLIGRRVSEARRAFAAGGWATSWTLYDSTNGLRLDSAAIARDFVVDAEHMANGRLLVSVSAVPVSQLHGNGLPGFLERLSRGC
jgi:hypothetical protein